MRSVAVVTVVLIACLLAEVAARAEATDWHGLFRDLISTDPQISNPARELSFKTLIPALETEDHSSLDQDLRKIIEVFQDNNEMIRLQASGLLAGLARTRADGTEAMKRAIPVWISQFDDRNPRVRANAIRSIAILRPDVPSEAVPVLLRIIGDGTAPPDAIAALALVRCSPRSSDAQRRIADLMSTKKPIETRRAVVVAIGNAGVSDPVLVSKLGEALEDRELLRDALRAVAALGRGAVALRAAVNRLAVDAEEEISKAATTALKRIDQ
jgi:hypothetical protein